MKRLAVVSSISMLLLAAATFTDAVPWGPLLDRGQKVSVAIPNHFSSALVVVADKHRFFREHDLAADIRLRESGKDALAEMIQGRTDFAVVADTPFVRATLLGEKPVILAGIATVDGHHTIVANRASEIRSPRDLRGHRVGISRGTSSEYFLDRLLRYYGVSASAVERVNVDPSRMSEALALREVDAVCTWKPWQFSSKEFVKVPADGIYTWDVFLVARRETAANRPELCTAVVASLLDAESYAIRHRSSLPGELAPYYRVDLKSFETYWASIRLNVGLDHAMIRSLEDETRCVMAAGVGQGLAMPNYIDTMVFAPLETLQPSAVTIVHEGGRL